MRQRSAQSETVGAQMTEEQKYYAEAMYKAALTGPVPKSLEEWYTAYQNVIAAKYQNPVDVLARQLFDHVNQGKDPGVYTNVAAYWRDIAAAALEILKP